MKCPHIECESRSYKNPMVQFFDCITEPGAVPSDGDIGCCATCGGWWTMKDGDLVIYEPNYEERVMAADAMPESKARFKEIDSQ